MAFNKAITRRRRLDLERRALPTLATGEPLPVADREADEALWEVVRALPGLQQKVVVLRYLEGRAHTEIAEILGCSAESARQAHSRAKASLRTALPAIPWIFDE